MVYHCFYLFKMVMFQFATFNHRVTIRWNGRFCWRSKVQVFVIVVQFLWELKQNQPILTRSMAPALNSGEDEIEKKFQAMVKAGPCSSAGIVYIPSDSIKDTHATLLGRAVFMMVRSGEWLPKKSLRLGVWSSIFGSRDVPGLAHPWQKFKSLWLTKRIQYIRVISSLQFQVFQFELVCKHLGLSKKAR